jgi:trans-aconitate methyltransferase
MNQWKKIWNKDERIHQIILETLIKADGFDSGAGSFSVEDWIDYTDELYDKLDIKNKDSIYDIGCGSGAFIYHLYLKNHQVGGVDYSTVLIDLANRMMPQSDFIINDASAITVSKKYDLVVSHSVFHYFRDLDYAKTVLEKMVDKASYKIAIFDINDENKKEAYHKVRMGDMSQEEYAKKYSGLEHMFYQKEWFEYMAKELGLKIEIFDQSFSSYTNASLRFNIIMEKV